MPSALATFKLLGLVGVASYALARVAVRLRVMAWHRANVIAVPRSGLPTMPRGFSVREVGFDELARWTVDVTPDQQATRFVQGISCLAAFNPDGDLTGLVWLTAQDCSEGDLALVTRPPDDAAWDTGMWIHPGHRLGRTFSALWAGVGEWLDTRGLAWSCSAIADYNMNSIGAHRRLGMVRVGSITALRIGRWQWIAAGAQRWRMIRPGGRMIWQIPPVDVLTADAQQMRQTPSIAG